MLFEQIQFNFSWVITASLLTGCAKETNPKVGLNFSTYTAQNWFWKAVLPSAHAAMSNGKLSVIEQSGNIHSQYERSNAESAFSEHRHCAELGIRLESDQNQA